mgnify:CR=1 FL=1
MSHESVQNYYGEVLQGSEDLQTNACCSPEDMPQFVKRVLSRVHDEVLMRYYGCGLVMPFALEGARVLGSVATGLVYGISLVSVFAMALTMARVVYVYANLLFSSVIAMFSVSFAGLEALTGNAQRSLLTLVGIGLEIIALNLVLFLALDLTKEVTNEAYPVTAAGMMLMFDVIACVMAWTVPANVGRLATRGAAS